MNAVRTPNEYPLPNSASFPVEEIFDTLEYARRLWPKIIENDNEENIIPIELRGRHSLKAWGYRLTNQKGDYEGPWDLYSEAMMDY